MITLGVETSCDETSCAILKDDNEILSNVTSSSLDLHRAFGGVVPEIASRHCLEVVDLVYQEALTRAKVTERDLDLIAVTYGPGLIGSLLVGVSFAKALSYGRNLPLVPVNHLEAHLDANFIENKKPEEPYVGLIVSGGHTTLVHYKEGAYALLGETSDDAVGEAYDKVAKLLGLGYPGGPLIDKLAQLGDPKAVSFTKPKLDGKLKFSFSGIKTAVFYYLEKKKEMTEKEKQDLCASFQETVVSWVVEKTLAACEMTESKIIVTGGGVTANSLLRKRLTQDAEKKGIKVFIPPLKYTTDNAAMIARNGYEKHMKFKMKTQEVIANPNLAIGRSAA